MPPFLNEGTIGLIGHLGLGDDGEFRDVPLPLVGVEVEASSLMNRDPFNDRSMLQTRAIEFSPHFSSLFYYCRLKLLILLAK